MSAQEATAPMRPSLLPWQDGGPAVTRVAGTVPWHTRCAIAWERVWRWEFWPSWLYYLPIALWVGWLGVRHRCPMAFTAANPGLEAGGVVGERKHAALAPLLANAPDLAATFALLNGRLSLRQRLGQARAFAALHGFPVVLKPDIGQRGRGVFVARDDVSLRLYLRRFDADVIVQRYVGGEELGVYVMRRPGELDATILSIVHKTFPRVVADGRHSLRELILRDERARLVSALLFARWANELELVPQQGEVVQLVDIGAHCRGSLFLDAGHLATPTLAATLTRLMDAVPGYAFGRMDLRVPSLEAFSRGEGLQVLELNGVSAESAHIYHPGTPLLTGYRAMFRQWSLAFEIGVAHVQQGVPTTPALTLLRRWRKDQRRDETWF